MFKTRLLSGIVLVVIALGTIITGGYVLLGTLLIISMIGMYELYRIFSFEKKGLGIVCYAFAILYYISMLYKGVNSAEIFKGLLMGLTIGLMMAYVFTYPKYQIEHVMAAFFGFLYVGVMLSYIYQTRMLADGAFLVWLVFLGSWGCDTCAYCVGVLFGKHKMAPVLSPKKSVEGAVGGVVGATVLGALYAVCITKFAGASASPLFYAIICGAGGLISMVGDLAASAIKRNHKIKDYGTLIPGHGGILDRFDSVIFIAPIIYYMSVLMIR